MKITLINGNDRNNDFYDDSMENICEYLNKKKVTYNINDLNKLNLKNCTGCDSCQNIKPGICVINDGINDILKEYLNSDIAIIITPIQFGTCNSTTKKFIDRTQPLFLPYQTTKKGKTIMKKRYAKYPDIIVVGIAYNNDIASIEAFRNTFMNCNLFAESNKTSIQIVKNKLDLEKINFLELKGR